MALNVNRQVEDVFYRYKMPRLIAKVEGKGNGIKTVIANMPEIAKSLNRPPTYPTKYFGCELGAQTQFDLKNERYIVNGDHDAAKLQDILDGFIKKFVLCPGCDNPETNLICKKGVIYQTCKACGYGGNVDMKHKLTTFIMKNPPPKDDDPVKKAKGQREGSGSPAQENGGEDVGFEFEHNENGIAPVGGAADDDWADDGAGTRKEQLTGAMMALAMNPDLERPLEDRLDMFYNYLVKCKSEAKGGALNSKAVVSEAERLDIREKGALLLCRALFDAEVLEQIELQRNTLLRMCTESPRAQRYLLGGIEQLVVSADFKDILLPKIAHILNKLYDKDIVDEEVMLEWGKKPSKKYVSRDESKEILAKAEPFLNWLKEAEEESEDEEEDEVKFDTAPAMNGRPKPAPAAPVKSEEDDFNIDDI